ncbi:MULTISPECIES: glycosyltransferase family 2 protein [Vibrio]|uniref:Glycosyltransferase n=1 Tax=Vibrio algicola TaxID=2662262 RepID=A0A5Q0TKQ2_9VIBR|nr:MULTISPECIES: glycosyltransferase family 2 protein [Vibrio]MBD1575182.1 glycosyltransferase family 2 protein [Vibrio sp. S11_S32]
MSTFSPCFLIPCYNHGQTMAAVVASLQVFNFPILIVDDGSDNNTKQVLEALQTQPDVQLITLAKNQGKGGAVMAGMRLAHQQGFSHALQIDADGQHDIEAIPRLIAASKQQPLHLISGKPVYDDSVPKSRLYGRYATHIWVWIETLSLEIKDSMCGFRSYPLAVTIKVIDHYSIGSRMDFDSEILVKLYWEGMHFHFIDTRVFYPEGGISHFDALHDNIRISKMHTRLFFGMLPRIPKLIKRHFPSQATNPEAQPIASQPHWAKRKERGTVIGIKLLMAVYSLFGRRFFTAILKLVMRYYHRTGKQARQASEQYLQQVQAYAQQHDLAVNTPVSSYQHLLSFGQTMLDKLAGWRGDINTGDLTVHGQQHFDQVINAKQGIVILGSHLGNLELCRALGQSRNKVTINALVFTEHAERFNNVMKAVNPDSSIHLIQVNSMGPDTAILLQQKLEQGEWIVIVGDRTSTTKEQRVVWADFLGKPAPFPQGPFLLATILAAPVYLLFGLRDETHTGKRPHFDVYFEPFNQQIKLPRKQRTQAMQALVQQYANRLQHFTLQAPLQWYNFFNFWQLSGEAENKTRSSFNSPNQSNSSEQHDNSESK